MLELNKTLARQHRQLYTVLVTTLKEECGCIGESAEKIHQDEWIDDFFLERWRLSEDMIEVYKTMRGIDRADSPNFFLRVETPNDRRYSYKMRRGKFNGDVWDKWNKNRMNVGLVRTQWTKGPNLLTSQFYV